MIYHVRDIISIRDFSDYIHWLHIEKPVEEELSVTLGESNNLWGSPDDSKIVFEEKRERFFDKNGHYNLQFTADNNSVVLIEMESMYFLEKLSLLDRNIRVLILLSDFSNAKQTRIIYAFFLQSGQVLNFQGKKVKSQHIQNYIQSQPDDLSLRVMLIEQSFSDWINEYKASDMLTAQEFADYLKMPLGTFQNKLSKGEILAPKKIGGSNRWQFKDIFNWIDTLAKT